jgi:hypothetical protein
MRPLAKRKHPALKQMSEQRVMFQEQQERNFGAGKQRQEQVQNQLRGSEAVKLTAQIYMITARRRRSCTIVAC